MGILVNYRGGSNFRRMAASSDTGADGNAMF